MLKVLCSKVLWSKLPEFHCLITIIQGSETEEKVSKSHYRQHLIPIQQTIRTNISKRSTHERRHGVP